MKKPVKVLLNIVMAALVVLLSYVVWSSYRTINPPVMEETHDPNWTPPPIELPDETPEVSERPRIENGQTMVLGIAGDMIMHSGLHTEAEQEDGSYDYAEVFAAAAPYIQSSDYVTSCFEAALIEGPDYTGYPEFGSPDDYAKSMKALGIDLVSLANNQIMDYGKDGLDRTLDVLDDAGVAHVGAYRTQEERDASSGITRAEANGVSMAFLSYTYATNGIAIDRQPDEYYPYAVNVFFEDYLKEIPEMKEIKYDMIAQDMAAAREMGTDLIIVYMHWSYEYETSPSAYQYELADFLFAEGADIIIGGHPRVPQPMELRQVIDNEGNEKTGYICYSLGNFISCQIYQYSDLTAIAQVIVEKDLDTGKTYVTGVRYYPMFMVDAEDYGIEDAGYRYRLLDLRASIAGYEAGDGGPINEELYNAMKQGLRDIQDIMGAEFDAENQSGGQGES